MSKSYCPNCGGKLEQSSADDASVECEDCVYYEREEIDVDLPPCWKESNDVPGDLERLFVHLDGPGFIGVRGDEAELVTADLANGEDPDPVIEPATPEKVRTLAESYNDDFYGSQNEAIQSARQE